MARLQSLSNETLVKIARCLSVKLDEGGNRSSVRLVRQKRGSAGPSSNRPRSSPSCRSTGATIDFDIYLLPFRESKRAKRHRNAFLTCRSALGELGQTYESSFRALDVADVLETELAARPVCRKYIQEGWTRVNVLSIHLVIAESLCSFGPDLGRVVGL